MLLRAKRIRNFEKPHPLLVKPTHFRFFLREQLALSSQPFGFRLKFLLRHAMVRYSSSILRSLAKSWLRGGSILPIMSVLLSTRSSPRGEGSFAPCGSTPGSATGEGWSLHMQVIISMLKHYVCMHSDTVKIYTTAYMIKKYIHSFGACFLQCFFKGSHSFVIVSSIKS